ncbi:tetratricopeptide repeat protein [Coleofasciculus sp. FACHB-SPT9]|uniref:tetratricopeptide repeat protein n=1 Tax=Cyanophyceae TaxID=3028117 RepID=UPI001689D66D|nr:tetratricopeptide repeat protein [Coleofasciculus sp. FACHB-SPT9]MBD1889025.1 tetratricopeptide repeat protein [Coleofasciculus sp. FACHB-SPT9]
MQNLLARLWLQQRRSSALGLGIAAVLFLLCSGSAGWAATAADNKPKPNPLEITTPDPLLPQPQVDRPLTPGEISQFRQALDELNAQAAAQLKAGNAPAAFEIWYRELRLRRSLGTVEEVEALGRVGAIAWENNQKLDLQIITKRLQAIQDRAFGRTPEPKGKTPRQQTNLNGGKTEEIVLSSPVSAVDIKLLQALGQAYQQIRLPAPALEDYQLLLADARQRQDKATEEAMLKIIAQLHLNWFDYPKAAATYEELLSFATQQGDTVNQVVYLQQLTYIYDKAKQPENSLKVKQRLAESYLAINDLTQIPALKIAIATDYEALKQPDEASKNYQEAYNIAWSLQQFASASEALKKLGDLYRTYKQPEYALQVYQTLLQVERQSYDYYNLMKTYDQIGQIYLERGDLAPAKAAFEQGLELAKSLKYQETYFANQLVRVTQQGSQ